MIIQILLTVGLLFIGLYGYTQKRRSLPLSIVICVSVVIAMYFVWAPAHANAVAHRIGVGRGADLVFYCWGLISLLLLVNLQVRLLKTREQITLLARRIAIVEAEALDQQIRPPPACETLPACSARTK